MPHTVLDAIATGHPPHRAPQTDAAAFMERVTSLPERIRERIPQIYASTAIDSRQSCITDYIGKDPEAFEFFPPTWSLEPAPSTGARNALYRKAVLPLAHDVARRALEDSGTDPASITHVVTVSCTGFFAPGLGIHLVRDLGLRPTTARTHIGFMGCYAAFNALRVADAFCRSTPGARVLVVCAELCTLHFQVDDTLERAVVNALFSDGAAAAILRRVEDEDLDDALETGALAYEASHAHLDGDSLDYMTWDLGDTGFNMTLSPRVPVVIGRSMDAYLGGLLTPRGLGPNDIDFWAIHPGGKAIVQATQRTLALSDDTVADSLAVLREHGNMSSPTILFVLKRFLDRHRAARAEGQPGIGTGVALAFGPGLTLEGCLWRTA